jgi:hypothetical protein
MLERILTLATFTCETCWSIVKEIFQEVEEAWFVPTATTTYVYDTAVRIEMPKLKKSTKDMFARMFLDKAKQMQRGSHSKENYLTYWDRRRMISAGNPQYLLCPGVLYYVFWGQGFH